MVEKETRRDFIFIVTGAVAAIGVGGLAWPFISSMKPGADTKAGFGAGLDVDLSKIEEGRQLKVLWMNRPIFIRHRTVAEIQAAQDFDSSGLVHPETDQERLRPLPNGNYNPKFLVMVGICKHFGSVPVGGMGDFDGWYCLSHGAHFDTSGRLRKGPGIKNMTIPPYHYTSETVINLRPF